MQRVIGFVFTAAIVGGLIWWRVQSDKELDARIEEVQSEMVEMCTRCKSYAKHKAFFEEWSPDAHEMAYEAAYTPSGRRRSAKFDEFTYCSKFFGYLAGKAQTSGMREVADELRQLQIEAEKKHPKG